jgi:hypothetical protein
MFIGGFYMKITRNILYKYDSVDELIEANPEVKTYTIFDVMNTEEELFVTGCHCIVKNSLGLLQIEGHTVQNPWLDIYMTKSYLEGKYIKLTN